VDRKFVILSVISFLLIVNVCLGDVKIGVYPTLINLTIPFKEEVNLSYRVRNIGNEDINIVAYLSCSNCKHEIKVGKFVIGYIQEEVPYEFTPKYFSLRKKESNNVTLSIGSFSLIKTIIVIGSKNSKLQFPFLIPSVGEKTFECKVNFKTKDLTTELLISPSLNIKVIGRNPLIFYFLAFSSFCILSLFLLHKFRKELFRLL